MKKLIIRSMVVLLLFTLAGCGKDEHEHEYDNGVITKESTCTEEGEKNYTCTLCEETKIESVPIKAHTYTEKITKEPTYTEDGQKIFTCESCNNTYTESIPVLDGEPYNQNIYNQMVEFYDNGDYINALIIGRNALANSGEAKNKINEIFNKIFELQDEYFSEQIQGAIENSDYAAFDTLYYYKSPGHHIKFNDEQEWVYKFVHELQGEYRYFESTDSDIHLEINGFNLKVDNMK